MQQSHGLFAIAKLLVNICSHVADLASTGIARMFAAQVHAGELSFSVWRTKGMGPGLSPPQKIFEFLQLKTPSGIF